MQDENPAGRPNDRHDGKSIDREWTYGALADKRSGDLEDVVVQRLRIAQQFDDTEAREDHPDPLTGRELLGGDYRVDGDGTGEWLRSSLVIPVGGGE